jgi:hypothetical protein
MAYVLSFHFKPKKSGLQRYNSDYSSNNLRLIYTIGDNQGSIAPPRSRTHTILTTSSIFVIPVAVALAWWMKEADPKDMMVATAGYAAILVVIVGAGTTATS